MNKKHVLFSLLWIWSEGRMRVRGGLEWSGVGLRDRCLWLFIYIDDNCWQAVWQWLAFVIKDGVLRQHTQYSTQGQHINSTVNTDNIHSTVDTDSIRSTVHTDSIHSPVHRDSIHGTVRMDSIHSTVQYTRGAYAIQYTRKGYLVLYIG